MLEQAVLEGFKSALRDNDERLLQVNDRYDACHLFQLNANVRPFVACG